MFACRCNAVVLRGLLRPCILIEEASDCSVVSRASDRIELGPCFKLLVSTTLATAREQVARAMPLIDVPRHEAAIADLESRSSMADLWDDVASAEATLRELSEHRAEVERSVKWARTLEDAEAALLLLPDLTDEPEAAVEMLSDELAQLHALTAELDEWEVRQLAGRLPALPEPGPGPGPGPELDPP